MRNAIPNIGLLMAFEASARHGNFSRAANELALTASAVSRHVAALEDLRQAAEAVSDRKTARAIESILLARKGIFDKPVPSFKAFQGVLSAFLAKDDLICC